MGVTSEIVRFVCATSFDDLPEEVTFRTETLIADAVGTMLAGSCEEGSRILQRYIQQTGLIERSLRQSTVLSQGGAAIFFTRPLSATLILLSILLLAAPLVMAFLKGKRSAST